MLTTEQSKVIDVAKGKIFGQSKSISQIVNELGFNIRSILLASSNKKRVIHQPNIE